MKKVGFVNETEIVGRSQQRENKVGPGHINEMTWGAVEYMFNNINH